MRKYPIQSAVALGCGGCLTLVIILTVVFALVATISSHFASSALGGACVTQPFEVAAGTGNSIYIEDSRGVTHYSSSGAHLSDFPLKNESFVTDDSGNLYYLWRGSILEVSAAGHRVKSFHAAGYQPAAVFPNGDVVAVKGGALAAADESTTVETFSPNGNVLSRWRTPYASTLVVGRGQRLYGNGGLNAGGDLVQLDPATGHVVRRFPRPRGSSFDALTADPHGNIYVGATTSADVPFAVEKLNSAGRFQVLQTDEESVAQLAVVSNGSIYVLRASYDEPGPSDAGLFQLSPSGSSQTKFAFCKR